MIAYSMEEPAFADASDAEDAELKMIDAFKEDFPEAYNISVNNIQEVKKKSG